MYILYYIHCVCASTLSSKYLFYIKFGWNFRHCGFNMPQISTRLQIYSILSRGTMSATCTTVKHWPLSDQSQLQKQCTAKHSIIGVTAPALYKQHTITVWIHRQARAHDFKPTLPFSVMTTPCNARTLYVVVTPSSHIREAKADREIEYLFVTSQDEAIGSLHSVSHC